MNSVSPGLPVSPFLSEIFQVLPSCVTSVRGQDFLRTPFFVCKTKRTVPLPRDDMTLSLVSIGETGTPGAFAQCSTTNVMVAMATMVVMLMSADLLFPVSQSERTAPLAPLCSGERRTGAWVSAGAGQVPMKGEGPQKEISSWRKWLKLILIINFQ